MTSSGDEMSLLLRWLRAADCQPLGFVTAKDFPETRGGVYLFTTPDDASIVYVGQGSNLRERLQWHAGENHGGPQDFVIKVATLRKLPQCAHYDPDGRKYLVRHIVIEDKDQRNGFEKYAIATLVSPFKKTKRVSRPSP